MKLAPWLAGMGILASPVPAAGQDARAGAQPERIDLSRQARDAVEDCSPRDVDVISQAITVCRRLRDDSDAFWNSDARRKDHAERTAFRNDAMPVAVNVLNLSPMVGVSLIANKPCDRPSCPIDERLLIDVKALPEAPPGSDAERAGGGITPAGKPDDLSPPGSASPAAAPSD